MAVSRETRRSIHPMTAINGTIFTVTGILLLVCLALPAAKKLQLQFTVMLALLGLGLGSIVTFHGELGPAGTQNFFQTFVQNLEELPISSETFLALFLPLLLFESAIALNLRSLTAEWLVILIMAVFAVVVATVFGGYALYWAGLDSFILALLIASIVATTDPVAVIGIFRDAGVSNRLASLVEGESLLNDAAAIAVFVILIDIYLAGTAPQIGEAVTNFIISFIGGLVIGGLLGWFASFCLDRLDQAGPAEVTVSVVLAYLSYILAANFAGVSGVVSVVAAGLVFSALGRRQISNRNWQNISAIWRQIGFWASSLIIVLALMLAPATLVQFDQGSFYLLGALIVGMLLARASVLFVMLPGIGVLYSRAKLPLRLRAIAWWGGLRGAVTLALALSVLEHPFVSRETGILVANLATGFVLFTLFVQGVTLAPAVNWLGLGKLSPADRRLKERLSEIASSTMVRPMAYEAERLGIDWSPPETPRQIDDDASHDVITEAESIDLALNLTSVQELEIILESRAQRLISRRLTATLVAEATLLRDSARERGLAGYREQAIKQHQISPASRLALELHRRLRFNRLLASQLAEQFEQAIGQHRILTQLSLHIGGTLAEILGDAAAETCQALVQGRLQRVEKLLDAIRLQYPAFWQQITRRHLNRISYRIEYEFYRKLDRDGLLSPQLWQALRRRAINAHNTENPLPTLDLGLDVNMMIKRIGFFDHLDERRINRLVPLFRPLLAVPGEMLIRRGEHGDRMFVIESGAVEVEAVAGKFRLGSGEFFGELALLTRKPRNANVTAMTYCRLLSLSRTEFRWFLRDNPDLMADMRMIARKRLKNATDKAA